MLDPSSGQEQCTSHRLSGGSHDGALGIGCVKSGCCQYGLQIDGLCAGEGVCCFTSDTCGGGAVAAGCPNIISRSEWGARAPNHAIGDMDAPAKYVFIHHGSSGWTDIGYNFVVGEDGSAYMARGWTEIGAHTYGYNSVGIAICVIGDFNDRLPNDKALNKIKQLIQCGLEKGHIDPNYTLKGHRDVGETDCPGDQLYNLIHQWPHYASGTQRYGR
nr:hypothetical protein BaRGS_021773 [Batillaria attramentaria]